MSVAIVDYGSGNLRSAAKAFERAARECGADRECYFHDRRHRQIATGFGNRGLCGDHATSEGNGVAAKRSATGLTSG